MQRAEAFVHVMRGLIEQASELVNRASVDSVAAERLNDVIDNMGIIVDDHVRPVRPYADVLIPKAASILKKSKIVKHVFMEVDT